MNASVEPSLAADTSTEPPAASGTPDADRLPLSPEWLRQVAHEVRAGFPHPAGDQELVLIDVDPRHLHAFWTVSPAAVEAARKSLADELPGKGDTAPLVLRVSEWSDGRAAAAFDVEVVGLQGTCYIDVWGEARQYRATLGLRGESRSLTPLVTSAPVMLPALAAADAESRDGATKSIEPTTAATAAATTVSPAPPAAATTVFPAPAAATASEPGAQPVDTLPEPVRHPFPLPPTEAGEYVPERLAEGQVVRAPAADPAKAALPETVTGEPAAPPAAAGGPVEAAEPAGAPGGTTGELPEPVRYDFPLPPTAGDYVPELIGGFLSADTPSPEPQAQEFSPGEGATPSPGAPPGPCSGEPSPPPDSGEPLPLPLESVLSLSSFALGREQVEFEVNAELHIFGRARPGTELHLFGRKVALRPDGTFSITRPLPDGALVLSALLVPGRADGQSD